MAVVTAMLAVVTAMLVLMLAPPALAGPAERTRTGSLSVTIDAMSPSFAKPGATVRLSGTVSNGTRQTQAGLEVQLYTSAAGFTSRDGMSFYLTSGRASGLVTAGNPFPISASLPPGSTASWTASFQVSAHGISGFGVYPVTAQLQDLAGGVFTSDQTLLPFWPGQQAAGLRNRLKISWLWPLIDQPNAQVCPALASNDLAASLRQDGRLAALLGAGASHAAADLTWVIDPALLGDVAAMARRYHVGGKANCTRAASEPALPAAASWLATLRAVTADQQAVITPYANVDMTALVHQGMTGDLAAAYKLGDAVAHSVLHGTSGHQVAWPADGTADLSVLTRLATAEHVGTVVLNSSEMPPRDAADFQDDAVTSLRVAGLPVNVLLADDTLTGVLRAGSGARSGGTQFAVRQRFLAETAMIAAEAPDSTRAIVVAPPQDWSPSQALASDLLGETTTAPWLAPARLSSLSSTPDTQRSVLRQPPPASRASRGELSRGYLDTIGSLGTQLGVYKSMLYKPQPDYVQSLAEALAATESAAWRGAGAAEGRALAGTLQRYLSGAETKVRIITSAQVPMGGSSGQVPVSIQNGLHQAIRVRVITSVVNSPGRTSQLTVGSFQSLVVVQAGQPYTVRLLRLPVSSAPQGSTEIQLSLASADGTPLPFGGAKLIVVSTRYGRAILFLIGAAMGVLVLTSVFRGVRRWLHGDAHVADEEAEPPGSVVTGTSGARYPTEAPDDLADARRWVDDA